ncbi:M15 family metallopeptidase [Coralloluteibacterium thermophilus]|uniref:M15 family metallopeptidase n=1 Tax=Coralloluteibacterium thermophilum TaxID=2707049 RepID=A0ABV9NKX2_9GAMM
MRSAPRFLVNTPDIELWPAGLLRARGNRDARLLAGADWLLRRKVDGRYLAAARPDGVVPLLPHWLRGAGAEAALDALDLLHAGGTPSDAPLTLDRLHAHLDALALDAGAYAARTGLAEVPEPGRLAYAGRDRFRRPLWLLAPAARAWRRLREAALRDGVVLQAISGYRSHAYQLGIVQRKRARGLSMDAILAVNAAPGYSEHHSGRALDIGTPGEPPAEESFEATPAFAWLQANAGRIGFRLSYPRDNPHGIVYEPWHWCWAQGGADPAK